MIKKFLLIIIIMTLVLGGVLAYQQRSNNSFTTREYLQSVQAHDSFYPEAQRYHRPLLAHEEDAVRTALLTYRRDGDRIWYIPDTHFFEEIELVGVQAESFVVIDGIRSKDHNTLYRAGIPFITAIDNPESIVVGAYLVSGGHLYYIGAEDAVVMSGADRASFIPLYAPNYRNAISYAKDKNYVYLYGMRIPSVDPESVEILANYYLQDKRAIYYFDGELKKTLVNAQKSSFEVLAGQDGYDAKDAYHYYYKGEEVEVLEI